jgi:hypothetical protein
MKFNFSQSFKRVTDKIQKINVGRISMDKDLKVGLIAIIILLIFGLLIRNIISEMIEKLFIFLILFSLSFLITHNWIISFFIAAIFYSLIQTMRTPSKEGFKNADDEEEKEETTETFETDDAETDKEFEKELAKDEKTNKNLVNSKVSKREKKDMDGNHDDSIANLSKMEKEVKELNEKFEGGIRLKDEDMSETKPLNIDFRNTKYSEDKMTPQRRAQMESYQLMDSIKQLETTIKSLNPVLYEGKKIMSMYENFKLD